MKSLPDIAQALSTHFGSMVTPEKLHAPQGSKTLSRAKEVGVFIAWHEGHDNSAIAQAFGYASWKSVSNVVSRAQRDFKTNFDFKSDAYGVAEKLGVTLD